MRYKLSDGVKAQSLAVGVVEQRGRVVVRHRVELQIQPGEVLDTTHDLSHWVQAGLIDEIKSLAPMPPVAVPEATVDPVQEYLVAAAEAAVAGHAPSVADPRGQAADAAPLDEAPSEETAAVQAARVVRRRKG